MQATTNIYFVADYKVEGVDKYSTLDDCIEYLSSQKEIGLDIETSRKYKVGQYDESVYRGGLDPYLTNICMIQAGTLDRVYVIDVRCFSKELLQKKFQFLNYNKDISLVIHNAKFEGIHLKHTYGLRLRNVWDTMLVEMNLRNGLTTKFSLAHVAEHYLKVPSAPKVDMFKDLFDSKEVTLDDEYLKDNEHLLTPFEMEENLAIDKSTRLQFINLGNKPFTAKQILYGADDITYPLLIKERQVLGRRLPSGEVYNPVKCHKIENTFSQVLADIELQGVTCDTKLWKDTAEQNTKLFWERKGKLEEYVLELYPEHCLQFDLFNPTPTCYVQWSSPKSAISFFRKLGICPKEVSKETKKLEWTVGAAALTKSLCAEYKGNYAKDIWIDFDKNENGKFIENHEKLILAFLLYKKAEQSKTTFGYDWLKYIHPITGKVHTSFRQILNTGRMSSTRPNAQQIPGKKEFRRCFTASEGNTMLNADYSAQEIRLMAEVTQDEDFLNFFTKKDDTYFGDFHSFTATKMQRLMKNDPNYFVPPKEILVDGKVVKNPAFTHEHNAERTGAKSIAFKINYGGGAMSLKDDLDVEEEVAEMFIQAFMEAFPTLGENFERTKKDAVENGYIVIDEKTDRRWFCPFFDEMKKLHTIAVSYMPKYDRNAPKLSKEEKQKAKEERYRKHPELKGYWKTYMQYKGKLERAGLNYRIQGRAAGQIKVSMNILRHKLITTNNNSLFLTLIVHDEGLAESTIENKDFNAKLLSDCMVEGGQYFCDIVPMEAATAIGDYWAH